MDKHNDALLRQFPGNPVYLRSSDTPEIQSDEGFGGNVDETFLNELSPKNIPKHKLALKPGVPVMILKNLSVKDGLANGARGVVSKLKRRLLVIKIGNKEHCIPRIPFKFSMHGLVVVRRQFPVRLSFAITVHKSQGQTLNKVGLDMTTMFFAHGQTYVGLSRARNLGDTIVLVSPERIIPSSDPPAAEVRNIVLPQLVSLTQNSQNR